MPDLCGDWEKGMTELCGAQGVEVAGTLGRSRVVCGNFGEGAVCWHFVVLTGWYAGSLR